MDDTKIDYKKVDECIKNISELIAVANIYKVNSYEIKSKYTVTKSDEFNEAVEILDQYSSILSLNIKLANNLIEMLTKARIIFNNLDEETASDINGDDPEKK